MGGSMPPMSVFPRNKKRERRRAPLPFVVSELVGHPAPCRVDDPVDHRLTQCAIIPFIYGEVAQLIVLDDMLVEVAVKGPALCARNRSEEHTSELQSLMRTSYAVFCLKKTNSRLNTHDQYQYT